MAPPEPIGLGPVQRLAFRLLIGLIGLLQRLPDGPLYRIAFAVGAGLSLVMPARRAVATANLARVCDWLVAEGLASPRVGAAARDRRRLAALVRSAFGHWIVSYVESALAPRYDRDALLERVRRVDPEASARAIEPPPPGGVGQIHMAMHFGSVDLSAIYGARVGSQPLTGPMEEVAHPFARAYFDHVRQALGATLVPIAGAGAVLAAALERGEAVGLVADRVIRGSGNPVELFGAPVRMPIGPAVLSVQSGATIYLHALERTGPGRWDGHTIVIRAEEGLSRRAAVRSIVEQEARAFERIIARAPDQWTTVFFPVWDDLARRERAPAGDTTAVAVGREEGA